MVLQHIFAILHYKCLFEEEIFFQLEIIRPRAKTKMVS